MDSETLYKIAHDMHYKYKDYKEALNGYLRVVREYPDSQEAKYAVQQIENMKRMEKFDRIAIEKDNCETAEKVLFVIENQDKIRQTANQEQGETDSFFDELIKYQLEERAKVLDEVKKLKESCLPVFNVVGCRGRSIKVFPDRVIITTDVTLGSLMTNNATDGEKTIFYHDVVGVQYKEPGITIGYLQLETASGQMNNAKSNAFSENTFTFEGISQEIKDMKEYIVWKIAQYKK